jgi:[ribosomal protein S5]-alanine N-acetyltransferase
MRDIITSSRLTLRRFTLADAARVCVLVGDFDVSKMISRAPYPYTMDDAVNWLSMHPDMWTSGGDYPFAITTPNDGVIGAIGLHSTTRLADIAPDAFEVGYWLGKDYWGLGYATEAGRALLAAFDSDLGHKSLVSGHFTENPQSGHVLEKLGFHYVGEPTTIFCVARQAEVPDVSMLRPAHASTPTPNPEGSPTP